MEMLRDGCGYWYRSLYVVFIRFEGLGKPANRIVPRRTAGTYVRT